MKLFDSPPGVQIRGPVVAGEQEILTPAALEFVVALHREFNSRRQGWLRQRQARQQLIDQGQLPNYLPETRSVREGHWQVLPVPEDLQDRRVEITGPVERKMVINALNSGANCFMADFEDAHSPTWQGTIEGQVNVRDAVRGTIEYMSAEGKRY